MVKILKLTCIGLLVIYGLVFIFLPFILTVVAVVVLGVIVHYILRLFGRRGFYIRDGNTHTWTTRGALELYRPAP